MQRISILNTGKTEKTIEGSDGKIYYLPPKRPTFLPAGVEIVKGMCKELKITISS